MHIHVYCEFICFMVVIIVFLINLHLVIYLIITHEWFDQFYNLNC